MNRCPQCHAPTAVWKREHHHDGITITYVARCTRCSHEQGIPNDEVAGSADVTTITPATIH